MLRRNRLKAVKWLLLAAILQVAAPAEAAFMVVCPAMAPAAGAGTSASMDMAGMDMAGMPGMDHGADASGSADPDRHGAPSPAPSQCEYECCTGGLVPLAAPAPSLPGVAQPLTLVVQVRRAAEAPAPVFSARTRLRPAIRAPPLSA